MTAQCHVRDSIREITTQSWLIGGRLLVSRSSRRTLNCLWEGEDGWFHGASEVSQATATTLQARNSTASHPFKLVYDAGDAHAVWRVGNAFVKVNIIAPTLQNVTRKHTTIAAVKAMSPSFDIPEVFYHGEWESRYYLVTSALPGQTLSEIWPSLEGKSKAFYVNRVVEICQELGQHHADYIGGVDKGQLGDLYLAGKKDDTSHHGLLKEALALGMDCSTFVFYHCDLGPGNLIIAPDGSVGVIDWETAGFIPKSWIRTKFRVGSGLDLPGDTFEECTEWRARVQRHLASEGYLDVAEAFMARLQSQ